MLYEDPQCLTEASWQWVTSHMPVACVDVVPIQSRKHSKTLVIGLIRRRFTNDKVDREVWCHVGGRIHLDEMMIDAAHRHLRETLTLTSNINMRTTPVTVGEFFRQPAPNRGYDPSKHAVSVAFIAELEIGSEIGAKGEALDFQWFNLEDLPDKADFWPGSRELILQAVRDIGWRHVDLTYQAVHASSMAQDQMMWQTPVLAITSMSFLLTIALGSDETWTRVLAGSLSAIVAFVSVQLMAKHSYLQRREADRLAEIEQLNGMQPVNGYQPVVPELSRGKWIELEGRLAQIRSRHIWEVALVLFGAASIVIAAVAVV